MRHRIKAVRSNESGFTLIELLIVIVILGVLSGIVVFAIQKFNNNGVLEACKTDVKTVQTAVEAYYAQNNGAYPSIAQLQASGLVKTTINPPNSKYTVAIDAAGNVTGTTADGQACQ